MPRVKLQKLCAPLIMLSFVASAHALAPPREASSPSQFLIGAPQDDDSALRALARSYFEAYARKDATAFWQMWSEKAPGKPARKRELEPFFEGSEKLELKSLKVESVTVESDRARIRVAGETMAGTAKPQKSVRMLHFVKEDGAWKIWRDPTIEEELAEAMVAAGSEEQRRELLASEPGHNSAAMLRAMLDYGIRARNRGEYDETLRIARLVEEMTKRLGVREVLFRALTAQGIVHDIRGDHVQSLELFRQSLVIAEEYKRKDAMGSAWLNIGGSHRGLEQYDQALEAYGKALVLAEEAQAKGEHLEPLISRALNNIGIIHDLRGDFSAAVLFYQRSITIKEQMKDESGLAQTFDNISFVFARQGDTAQALEYLQKSLVLWKELRNKPGMAEALNHIGRVYTNAGDPEKGLEYLRESLRIKEEIANNKSTVFALVDIGLALKQQRKYAEAMETLQRAMGLTKALGGETEQAAILLALALVHKDQGDYTKARAFAEQSVALSSNKADILWLAEQALGEAYVKLNEPAKAAATYERAITEIERQRRNVAGGEREQEKFFENKLGPYHGMVSLLAAQNKPQEAFAYAERAKGRVLLDLLKGGRASIEKLMTPDERARERELTVTLSSLNAQIAAEQGEKLPEAKRLADLEARLQKARLDYQAFETTLYAVHPELKIRRGEGHVVSLAQAAELLPDAKTTILNFVVTDERTYLFALTKGGTPAAADLKIYPIEIQRKELSARVEGFRRALAERDPAFKEPARKLYDLLLAPARAQLRGCNVLVIVPDDALWELPFQALQSAPDRYLLEESAISYAPSLSVLYEMKNQQQGGAASDTTLLAFGNPVFGEVAAERMKMTLRSGTKPEPLPDAEKEVKSLAEIYGPARSRVYTGAAAREEAAKTEAGKFRVLHFATHGVLNNSSPMYSHLLLSQSGTGEDGLLEAWEIMKLDLKADLVVLSACETARGRIGAGEGMIGLTWALFVAGSPATLVSQWKVDSAATKELMLDFHRYLRANLKGSPAHARKAEALRQAALKMMKSPNYKHPFHWASFVVIGDSK